MGAWTTRLRRHGGRANIEAKRAAQYAKLSRIREGHRRFAMAQGAIWFLDGYPLRVLSTVFEERMGWR
jgi:hypothetical protein